MTGFALSPTLLMPLLEESEGELFERSPENEIRFVLPNPNNVRDHDINISSVFSEFGVRFSPDATDNHRRAVEHLWLNCGGTNRFH
jgi:hypothetical protein